MLKVYLSLLTCAGMVLCLACQRPESYKRRPRPVQKNEKVFQKVTNLENFARPEVEILFVIDQSSSMKPHQENLRINAHQFVRTLGQNRLLQYRAGVTPASKGYKGKLWTGGDGGPPFITPNTPGGLDLFASRMVVGTGGDTNEVFFSQILPLLQVYSLGSKPFAKEDSFLALVFVTDTYDQSRIKAHDLYKSLVDFKGGDTSKVLAYGALIPPDVPATDCKRDQKPSVNIIEFIEMTDGGDYFSLCAEDFGTQLAAIADDLTKKVGNTIYLDRAADPDTLVITYGDFEIPRAPVTGNPDDSELGWSYNSSDYSIFFGRAIPWPDEVGGDGALRIHTDRAYFEQEKELMRKTL